MDTYEKFPKEGMDKASVINLIEHIGEKYGWRNDNDPYEDRQNDSPTVREFLELADRYGQDRIRFIGYTISPPRSDYRVSIEGFIGRRLTPDEGFELTNLYHNADVMDIEPDGEGLHRVRFWWD